MGLKRFLSDLAVPIKDEGFGKETKKSTYKVNRSGKKIQKLYFCTIAKIYICMEPITNTILLVKYASLCVLSRLIIVEARKYLTDPV